MKMEEKNNYTYEAAFKELQEIVQKIEAGDVDIDKLSDYIKRAGTLVKICETKLTETEEEVQILLKKLEKEDEEVEDYDSIDDDISHSIVEDDRSEEHTSELQSRGHLVCRLLLEKKKKNRNRET